MTPTASNKRVPDRALLVMYSATSTANYYSASDRTFWPIYGLGAGYLLTNKEDLSARRAGTRNTTGTRVNYIVSLSSLCLHLLSKYNHNE